MTRSFTISLGLARMIGPGPRSVDAEAASVAIYRAADRALYEAKQAGRNCVKASAAAVDWPGPGERAA